METLQKVLNVVEPSAEYQTEFGSQAYNLPTNAYLWLSRLLMYEAFLIRYRANTPLEYER